MTNNGLFLHTLSRSRDIQVFVSITDDKSSQLNHKIKNISGNIGVMLLKLGTSSVPRVRHKKEPTVLFLWQTILLSGLFHAH